MIRAAPNPDDRLDDAVTAGSPFVVPDAPDASVPQSIGTYTILKSLGEGGMGKVYLARHSATDWLRAIKTLQHADYADSDLRKRFVREAQAATRIRHENIVQIFEFGADSVVGMYYVMEYLDGVDLLTRLRARGRLPWSEVRDLLIQVARGLGCAHAEGVIHRDVKPENCFLVQGPSGERLKVIDFGIAKVVSPTAAQATATKYVIGSSPYIAPEQALQRTVDARTDLYSTGAMAFHLVTGRYPFLGNAIEQVTAHIRDEPQRPSEVAPDADISPEAEAIILKLLAKDPSARFQSMPELEQALIAVVPTQKYLPYLPARTTSSGVMNRRLFIGAGVIAVILAAGLLGWYLGRQTTPDNANELSFQAQRSSPGDPLGVVRPTESSVSKGVPTPPLQEPNKPSTTPTQDSTQKTAETAQGGPPVVASLGANVLPGKRPPPEKKATPKKPCTSETLGPAVFSELRSDGLEWIDTIQFTYSRNGDQLPTITVENKYAGTNVKSRIENAFRLCILPKDAPVKGAFKLVKGR